jgi:hypothetical protein
MMAAAEFRSAGDSTVSQTNALARLAARRGVRAAPFGAVAGAILGIVGGGGADSALTASETALVMAALLGFALVPAVVAAISVARRLRLSADSGPVSWIRAIGYGAMAGAAWAAVGALVMYGAGTLVELNLNLGGLLMTVIGAGVVAGGLCGLLVKLASLTARRDAETIAERD